MGGPQSSAPYQKRKCRRNCGVFPSSNFTLWVSIMNDTGSNLQTIFPTDLVALGYNQLTYRGYLGVFSTLAAAGVIYQERVMIEMQIIKADGTAVTPWFGETAVIYSSSAGNTISALGKCDAKSSLLRNCSRKCESLRRAEEKWHCNPTSCCISCLMYGIRALVRHKIPREQLALLVSDAKMRDIGCENIQRQALKYRCARTVILLTVDDMKEGRV